MSLSDVISLQLGQAGRPGRSTPADSGTRAIAFEVRESFPASLAPFFADIRQLGASPAKPCGVTRLLGRRLRRRSPAAIGVASSQDAPAATAARFFGRRSGMNFSYNALASGAYRLGHHGPAQAAGVRRSAARQVLPDVVARPRAAGAHPETGRRKDLAQPANVLDVHQSAGRRRDGSLIVEQLASTRPPAA
jgi:hypothetical protein